MKREQINIVIIGHVDHGKSTLLGRLLNDTGALPEGKLESVKAYCEKNSKIFEYAYLLDALKEEQSQGITIDAARCFFKTKKRDYLIIDAPGHFEFIKNMITGASRADAAIIVIDAKEGIRENTKRHGYILSILGLKYAIVVVNKMDTVEYKEEVFNSIKNEYLKFLIDVGVKEIKFIPTSARFGENIVNKSKKIEWYLGNTLLEEIESWQINEDDINKEFRFSVQDVYKFTSKNDERRILAGTIDYGQITTGEKVKFYPSGKNSIIEFIELFPKKINKAIAGQSVGFIIKDPFYISNGEIMVKEMEKLHPFVSRRFLATIFWMEQEPLVLNKFYKIRLNNQKTKIKIVEIKNVVDATDHLNIQKKRYLDRFDIGKVVIESLKPLTFDTIEKFKKNARFVLVDQYRIAGCGIVLEKLEDKLLALEKDIKLREQSWKKGLVTRDDREIRNKHKGKFIILTGNNRDILQKVSELLEKRLFENNSQSYFLSTESLSYGLDRDISIIEELDRTEEIRRIGEIARILTDAGLIFISYITDLDIYELELLEMLNYPAEIVKIGIGIEESSIEKKLHIKKNIFKDTEEIVEYILNYLKNNIILEYYI